MSNDEQSQPSVLSLEELVPNFEVEDFKDDDDIEEIESTNPLLYDRCVTIYNALYEQSQVAHEGRVFTGLVSNIFAEHKLSLGYYTPVMQRLRDMGCIEQIRRGGGGKPSVYMIYSAPTIGAYEDSKNRPSKASREEAKTSQLQSTVVLLSQRVGALESQLAILIEWKLQEDERRAHAERVKALKGD